MGSCFGEHKLSGDQLIPQGLRLGLCTSRRLSMNEASVAEGLVGRGLITGCALFRLALQMPVLHFAYAALRLCPSVCCHLFAYFSSMVQRDFRKQWLQHL